MPTLRSRSRPARLHAGGLALLSVGLLALAIAAPRHSNAAASANDSITMTPSSTEIHAPPGGTTSGSLNVINPGSSGYGMSLAVAPYRVIGDSYDPQFTELPGTTDASQWLHLEGPLTQNLAAHTLASVDYTLSVPAGTAPGGYYAVIFAETDPPAATGVVAHNRVGDILYITVDGPVKQSGTLSAPRLPRIVFRSSLPISVLVSNTGGLHFVTMADIQANSLSGGPPFHASLQRYVLPQTTRLVSTTWQRLPLFGLYKVYRSAVVAGQPQTAPTAEVLIIRPWLAAILGIAAIAALIGVVRGIRRRRRPQPRGAARRTP